MFFSNPFNYWKIKPGVSSTNEIIENNQPKPTKVPVKPFGERQISVQQQIEFYKQRKMGITHYYSEFLQGKKVKKQQNTKDKTKETQSKEPQILCKITPTSCSFDKNCDVTSFINKTDQPGQQKSFDNKQHQPQNDIKIQIPQGNNTQINLEKKISDQQIQEKKQEGLKSIDLIDDRNKNKKKSWLTENNSGDLMKDIKKNFFDPAQSPKMPNICFSPVQNNDYKNYDKQNTVKSILKSSRYSHMNSIKNSIRQSERHSQMDSQRSNSKNNVSFSKKKKIRVFQKTPYVVEREYSLKKESNIAEKNNRRSLYSSPITQRQKAPFPQLK